MMYTSPGEEWEFRETGSPPTLLLSQSSAVGPGGLSSWGSSLIVVIPRVTAVGLSCSKPAWLAAAS
eukprot:4033489-Amphidinium_carterae.1